MLKPFRAVRAERNKAHLVPSRSVDLYSLNNYKLNNHSFSGHSSSRYFISNQEHLSVFVKIKSVY